MSSLDGMTQYCRACENGEDGLGPRHTCGLGRADTTSSPDPHRRPESVTFPLPDTRQGMNPAEDPMRAQAILPRPYEVEPPGSLCWPGDIRQCLLALSGKCPGCLEDGVPGLDLVDGWGLMCERCETTVGYEKISIVVRTHLTNLRQENAALTAERDALRAERDRQAKWIACLEVRGIVALEHDRARVEALRWVIENTKTGYYDNASELRLECQNEIARLTSASGQEQKP